MDRCVKCGQYRVWCLCWAPRLSTPASPPITSSTPEEKSSTPEKKKVWPMTKYRFEQLWETPAADPLPLNVDYLRFHKWLARQNEQTADRVVHA
jgi:hypothetical protein